jgi:ketosteroid isomerase-like protein
MSTVFATSHQAELAFYRAFEALDLDHMGQIWSDAADTLCIHPGGGLLHGKTAIMQSWAEILGGAEKPAISIRPIQQLQGLDLAVHLTEESIRPRGQGTGDATRVLATNVYRREQGGWRLVEHHASLPLVRTRAGEAKRDLH